MREGSQAEKTNKQADLCAECLLLYVTCSMSQYALLSIFHFSCFCVNSVTRVGRHHCNPDFSAVFVCRNSFVSDLFALVTARLHLHQLRFVPGRSTTPDGVKAYNTIGTTGRPPSGVTVQVGFSARMYCTTTCLILGGIWRIRAELMFTLHAADRSLGL